MFKGECVLYSIHELMVALSTELRWDLKHTVWTNPFIYEWYRK
jgi:hypothetical protein